MSSKKPKKMKKHHKIPSEQATLPIQSPDIRDPQTRAAQQSDENVERAKRWVDEHEV